MRAFDRPNGSRKNRYFPKSRPIAIKLGRLLALAEQSLNIYIYCAHARARPQRRFEIAIFDFSARLWTLRPRCASSEGGGLLRPPLATEYSITRPNPAFLASLLKKLLKVEVAKSLGAIAGLSVFREILTFSRLRSTLTSDFAETKKAKTSHDVLPYV